MNEEDYILPPHAYTKVGHTQQDTRQEPVQNKTFAETCSKWFSDNMVTVIIVSLVIILGILVYYWYSKSEDKEPKDKHGAAQAQNASNLARQQSQNVRNVPQRRQEEEYDEEEEVPVQVPKSKTKRRPKPPVEDDEDDEEVQQVSTKKVDIRRRVRPAPTKMNPVRPEMTTSINTTLTEWNNMRKKLNEERKNKEQLKKITDQIIIEGEEDEVDDEEYEEYEE